METRVAAPRQRDRLIIAVTHLPTEIWRQRPRRLASRCEQGSGSGTGAVQAVSPADAAAGALIVGLAWRQFGWAGALAAKGFIGAVIEADQATAHDEIILAAKPAAAGLVSLGIIVLPAAINAMSEPDLSRPPPGLNSHNGLIGTKISR